MDDNPQSDNVLNSHQPEKFELNDDFSDLDDDVRSHQSEELDDDFSDLVDDNSEKDSVCSNWMNDTLLDEESQLFSQ